jgi:hypothetical protein
MDKKKKKYIVLTIIAVLLIGLLILINVIGAGTKSASAENTDTTVTEEYTDITQFAPSGCSKYLIYPASDESTNSGYKIVWFSGSVEPGFLNNYPQIINNDTLHLSCAWPIIGALGDQDGFTNWLMTTLDPNNMVETDGYINGMIYPNCAIKSTIYRSGTDLLKVSNEIYTSIDSLITSLINKKVRYVSAGHIISDITITMTDDGIYSDQDIYSNYEEISLAQIVPLLDNLYAVSNIPKDISQRVIDEANQLIKAKEDGYNEGYNEGTNRTWFGVFTDAVIEKIYKPNTWEDTSTDIIFTTYGISFDNAFAKIEEYRKTNQTPDTDAFYIQLKFSKPFKFQNDNDFYAKLYTNKKVMQSWFESETGRQIFITTDEEPNPNGFGYRIKTSEDLSEPITVQRLIICYTPYYKDTLASDFVDLGTGTNATEYNNGYVTGKNEGFENGYAQGKNDGYQNGYSAGLIEGQGPTTSIQKLIASVQAALNVDLFGSISLQDILNVMISIFFVLIALKLFAGG